MEQPNTNGTPDLQARLNDPQTAAALNRLLDRLDALEKTVDTVSAVVEQGPGMVAMFTDIADETARDAEARGINVDERLKSALVIAEKLTAPKTMNVLSGLMDRMDKLEQLIELADQAPGMVAMVADVADEAVRNAEARGVNVDERLQDGLAMLEKLTAPKTMNVLSGLMDRMDQLEQLLALADQAPGMMSMLIDMADEFYVKTSNAGISLDGRLRSTFELGEKLTAPATVDALGGVLDYRAVSIVGMAGQTLIKCQEECLSKPEPPRAGLFDLLKAARDPDLQHGIAFLINFGRFFGKGIEQFHATHANPTQVIEQ